MTLIPKTITTILLLSCLVYAQIQIEIQPGTHEKMPEVVVSGSDREKSGNMDTKLFNLTADVVKENLQSLEWKRKIGDPIINHASAYGYKDLYITLKPKLAKIIHVKDRIVQLKNVTIVNNDKIPKKFKPELQVDVTESIMAKWSDLRGMSAGHNIIHKLGFNRIEHASMHGQDDFASRDTTLNARLHNEIVLHPGQAIDLCVEAKETTLEVNIDYEISLDGDLYINYYCVQLVDYCFRGHNLDVNKYFNLLNLPSVVNSTETAIFTFYQDPQVLIFSDRLQSSL